MAALAAALTVPDPTPTWRWNDKRLATYQLLAGPQRHTLLVGGARATKTALICRAILSRALHAPGSRHALLRLAANAAWQSIAMDTLPKVAAMCWPQLRLREHSEGYFTTPEGSELWVGGIGEKAAVEKILGREFATLFINEASQVSYQARLMVLTRLAQVCYRRDGSLLPQREYVDLNPVGKSHWTYREFIEKLNAESRRPLARPDDYQHAFINPYDSLDVLAPEYVAELDALPERQRRRYFEGVYVDEIENALWSMECIDQCRIFPDELPDTFDRVVVAVDPSGTTGEEETRSDAVGINVSARRHDQAYVLKDLTCQLPPEGWGRTAVVAYYEHKADRIVAEKNFGGDMVRSTIAAAAVAMDAAVPPIELITSSHGKAVRAEPVSVLYGWLRDGDWVSTRVHHVGDKETFADLEDEMLNFSTAGYQGPRSPNRADSLIFALHDLMLTPQRGALWNQSKLT